MVFSDFHFYSEVLGIQTAAYILLPQPQVAAQSSSPIPVLYLLHGLSDDHTMWLRQTRVEQVCPALPSGCGHACGQPFLLYGHGAWSKVRNLCQPRTSFRD